MLIEFRSNSHARVTLFASVAKRLLDLMGAGAEIPGSLRADEVAAARRNLESALTFQQALLGAPADANRELPALDGQASRLIGFLRDAEIRRDPVDWAAP